LVGGLMRLVIDLRNNLREQAKKTSDAGVKKQLFAQTDLIRSRLKELGITLEDRKGCTDWRLG
jgi:cysteinyl-tRNA synthetase